MESPGDLHCSSNLIEMILVVGAMDFRRQPCPLTVNLPPNVVAATRRRAFCVPRAAESAVGRAESLLSPRRYRASHKASCNGVGAKRESQ